MPGFKSVPTEEPAPTPTTENPAPEAASSSVNEGSSVTPSARASTAAPSEGTKNSGDISTNVAQNNVPRVRNISIQEPKELSSAAMAKLEKVDRITGEYVQVMMLLDDMDVLSVYKVRNEEVDLQFVIAVSGAEQMESVKVLHGTTTESVDKIVQQGFKIGGVDVPVRHGSAHGKGVYLTTQPSLATSYSNSHNCKYVILSELCVTPDTKLNSKQRGRRPRLPSRFGDVYVQPDRALVRPLYVAEFRDLKLNRRGSNTIRRRLSAPRGGPGVPFAQLPAQIPAPPPSIPSVSLLSPVTRDPANILNHRQTAQVTQPQHSNVLAFTAPTPNPSHVPTSTLTSHTGQ